MKPLTIEKNKIPSQNSGEFLNWWFKKSRLNGQTENIFQSYYINYWKNFDGYLKNAWTDRHLELDEAVEGLKERKDARILDLGCGTGSVTLYLAYKLRGRVKVRGIDINKERLLCAEERLKILQAETRIDLNCDFLEANIIDLPLNKKFDIIYLEETFHHLEPRGEIAKKISDLLADNGLLIISEVNPCNPFMQAHLLNRRGLKTIVQKTDEHGRTFSYGNERILTLGTLSSLFSSRGLRLVKKRNFRLFSTSSASIFGRYIDLMSIEKKLIKLGLLKTLFTIHYNVVFKRDSDPQII